MIKKGVFIFKRCESEYFFNLFCTIGFMNFKWFKTSLILSKHPYPSHLTHPRSLEGSASPWLACGVGRVRSAATSPAVAS